MNDYIQDVLEHTAEQCGIDVKEVSLDLYEIDWNGNRAIITDKTKPNEPRIIQLKCARTGKDITRKQFRDGVASSDFNNACRVFYKLGA